MSPLIWIMQNIILHPFFLPSLLLLILIFFQKIFFSSPSHSTRKNPPPSPPKLPIIGNLHQLHLSLHHSLQLLSQQYDDLMLVYVGRKPILVASSANSIREILRTHDKVFSKRPILYASRRIFYDNMDVAFAPCGEYWRQLKNFCVTHLLSNQKVQSWRTIREEEVASMVEKISKFGSSVVNLRELIMTHTNDLICRVIFGCKYSNITKGGIDFKNLIKEAMELIGIFSFRDFIPWLSWIDWVKGLDTIVENVAKELDVILEKLIIEYENNSISTKEKTNINYDEGESTKPFIEILLEYERENKETLSRKSIQAIILDMLAPGTDTPYILIEWTMSEVIRHPRVLKQLQQEVRTSVQGPNVSELDLEKLIYLKAVIKESLRLHPPAPLLLPRELSQDIKINGFDISAGTRVLINAWAVHNDSTYWDKPQNFIPERFLNNDIISSSSSFKGQNNFQFIPFGGGRRVCPGQSFSMISAQLLVANLVYKFDWKLPDGVDFQSLDMAESVGINVQKKVPLMAIATTPYDG